MFNTTKEKLHLNIKNSNSTSLSILMFDHTGRVIQNSSYPLTQEITLDVTKLESGVYYLLLEDDFENTKTMKFIKVRD
jgi:hypothetical protein